MPLDIDAGYAIDLDRWNWTILFPFAKVEDGGRSETYR